MKLALVCLGVIGCGGTSGEPIRGDVTIHYGTGAPKLAVGTVVQNKATPAEMVVQIGTDNVDCGTYLDNFLSFSNPEGTFVYFSVDKTTPGPVAQAAVSVMKSNGHDTSINEASGMVTIDAIGPRVTGTVAFMTTDSTVGMIAVSGSFDVLSCL